MAQAKSILAADFGSVYTRVLLFDVVGGVYRTVARAEVLSTGGFPAGDVSLGLRQAAARIAKVTGRKLLDESGRIITPEDAEGNGVGVFVGTASGGRPLRSVLIGLMPGVSVESGVRATEGTYVEISEVISLGQNRTEEDQLNAVLLTNPDLVLVTGGTEGGAVAPLERMLKLVKTAMSAMSNEDRPPLLYAGNSDLAERVESEFGELTSVYVADNVRPTLDDEELDGVQLQLSRVFDRYKERQGGGFDVVGGMSTTGLFPTARSYTVVAEYLGKSRGRNVKGVAVLDVGSATGTLATYADGDVKTSIRTDVGVGTSAPDLVNTLDIDDIRRWVPYGVARADVMNYAMNKRLRPPSVPLTRKHLYLEHALLRAGALDMLRNQRPDWATEGGDIDVAIGSGSALCMTGNPGMTAMLLLDCLQPGGVTELYTDPNGMLTALGALAYVAPEAVVQLMGGDNLERIGTAFSITGTTNTRRTAAKYRIQYDDGTEEQGDIGGGQLRFFPLQSGKTAKVRVNARGGLRFGDRRSINQEIEGGTAGIIIDTRGRPISAGLDLRQRMVLLTVWYGLATGAEHEELPPEDLEMPAERALVSVAGADQQEPTEEPRRGRRGRKQAAAEVDEATIQEIISDSDIDEAELEAIFEGDEEDPFDDRLR